MKGSAINAVRNGLLLIAPPDKPYISRNGSDKFYLIDSRGAVSNILLRALIIKEMRKVLKAFKDVEVIAGISKSGTIWGAWLAWATGLPFANVLLDGKRQSGLQREIEGDINGKKVALVDNWLRTGLSIQTAKDVVKRNGGKIQCTIVITSLHKGYERDGIIPVWQIEELFLAAKYLGLISSEFKY